MQPWDVPAITTEAGRVKQENFDYDDDFSQAGLSRDSGGGKFKGKGNIDIDYDDGYSPDHFFPSDEPGILLPPIKERAEA